MKATRLTQEPINNKLCGGDRRAGSRLEDNAALIEEHILNYRSYLHVQIAVQITPFGAKPQDTIFGFVGLLYSC